MNNLALSSIVRSVGHGVLKSNGEFSSSKLFPDLELVYTNMISMQAINGECFNYVKAYNEVAEEMRQYGAGDHIFFISLPYKLIYDFKSFPTSSGILIESILLNPERFFELQMKFIELAMMKDGIPDFE